MMKFMCDWCGKEFQAARAEVVQCAWCGTGGIRTKNMARDEWDAFGELAVDEDGHLFRRRDVATALRGGQDR